MKALPTPDKSFSQSSSFASPSFLGQPQQVIEDMLKCLHILEVREFLLPEIRELCAYERTVTNDSKYNYIILTNEDRDNTLALYKAYDDVLEEAKPLVNKCNDLLGFGEGRRKNITELEEHFYIDPSNSEAMDQFTQAMSRIKVAEIALDDLLLSPKICERFVKNYVQVAHLLNRTGWENTWINNIYSIIPASYSLESTPQQATRPTTAQSEGSASGTNLSSLFSVIGISTPTQLDALSSSYSGNTTPFSTPLVSSSKSAANRFLEEAARTKQDESKQR